MLTFSRLGVFTLAALGTARGLSVRQAPDDIAALLGASSNNQYGGVSSSAQYGGAASSVAVPQTDLKSPSDQSNAGGVVFDTVRASDVVDRKIDVPGNVPKAGSPAPAGMRTITDADNAPVGALEIPDDVGGSVFSAASFAVETFQLAGVDQVVATNFDDRNCPQGQGRPIDQPNAHCSHPRGSIEGYTFIDNNQNMFKEAGEVGVPGILVTISDKAATFRASVRTDANGHYVITNLPPGTYYLTIDITKNPDGLTPVFDQTAVVVQPFTNTLQDFPYQGAVPPVPVSTASAEAYVFVDTNYNGVYDASDSPYSGAIVNLFSSSTGSIVATTRSEGSGLYSFTGVAPGSYSIQLDRSSIVSSLTPKTDRWDVQLTSGQVYTNANFVLEPPRPSAKIGPSYVFLDDNRNGVQDNNERGLAGVVVKLMVSVSQTVMTTSTDANGAFSFSNLVAGTYILQLDTNTLPAGYTPAFSGGRLVVTLATDQTYTNANFPINSANNNNGQIATSRVYVDTNKNNFVDSNESGFAGVVISLQANNQMVVASKTTDANGYFTFDNVPVGDYAVLIDRASVPSQYVIDSISSPRVNVQAGVVTPGITIRLIDASGVNPTSTEGMAFVDDNRNSQPDVNEAPVPDVSILLLLNGQVMQTTTTDASGRYSFPNVAPGTYTVKVDQSTMPFGLSTIDPSGQYPLTVTVTSAAGVYIPFQKEGMSSIQGDVKANDLPLANVKVNIMDESGRIVQQMITDSTGRFASSNLLAGVYNVQVDEKTIPSGLTPANANTPRLSAAITWSDSLNVEFRYQGENNNGNVGVGYVFVDSNNNGVKDANEAGLAGVTVDLLNVQRDVLSTITTGADGMYSFRSVRPGTYEVRLVTSTLPAGYTVTKTSYMMTINDSQGTTDLAVNFPAVGSGYVTSTATTTATAWPTGLGSNAAVSGLVYRDSNRNNVPDSGDLGIGNVMVKLLQNNLVLQNQMTSANGRYSFRNLPAGTYTIQVEKSTLPIGHDMVRNTATVNLYENQDYYGSDVYFAAVASANNGGGIVGAVYRHNNNVPVPNVLIRLYDANNNQVKQTYTGADGTYTFPDLPRGDYTVVVDQNSLPQPMILMDEPDHTLDGRVTVTVDAVPRTVTFRYDLYLN